MNRNSSTLVIQDDNYSGSLHLDELLLDAIPHAQKGAAAFAFATADGLSAIFDSEEFARYCANGHHFDLYLGIDSITDLRALERAKELIDKHDGRLNVRVYYDSTNRGIFHPRRLGSKTAKATDALPSSGRATLRTQVYKETSRSSRGLSRTPNHSSRPIILGTGGLKPHRHPARFTP